YRIDGIRFDAAKQLDNFEALRGFVANARQMSEMKPFFTVAEYIPPSPVITEPRGPVESCWNDAFMYAVTAYLSDENKSFEDMKNSIDPTRLGYANITSATNYLANHDQNRLFQKLGEKGILDEELYRRAKLGALILLTSIGVPMIWMGGEFGEHVPMSEHSNKINWTLLKNERNKNLHDYYKVLIELRTNNAVFQTSNIEFFHENEDAEVICFHRYDDSGNGVAIVLNLSDNDLNGYSIPNFPFDGECNEITKTLKIRGEEGVLKIDLPRREGLLFIPV
ncbi:MAG: alpha-amylase family glycosyl hydrolase, partial [Candidatus Binatia bacterium]